MKLLYLVFKTQTQTSMEFESYLPMMHHGELSWYAHFSDHLNDVVRGHLLAAKENVYDLQFHAVIVEDEEAERIRKSAELRTMRGGPMRHFGQVNPKKMCILARITFSYKNETIKSIEFNETLHPAYHQFFEKKCRKSAFISKNCVFEMAHLEHQSEQLDPLEKQLLDILRRFSLKDFYCLDASGSTSAPLSQIFKDFLDGGNFRQSTRASLRIVYQALLFSFKFSLHFSNLNRNPEDFIKFHASNLLRVQFDDYPNDSFMDAGPFANRFSNTNIIKKLLGDLEGEVSRDQIRNVMTEMYSTYSPLPESLLDCVFEIINMPAIAEAANLLHEAITKAHGDLMLRTDLKKISPDTQSSFKLGTELFPLAAPQDQEQDLISKETAETVAQM